MSLKSKQGFTIIEVVLVLAIAGLIFLMVFIALPNMQRSQRDTQRRNDFAALSSNITAYITNNNGSLPATGNLAANKYVNESGEDPDGNTYLLSVKECSSDATCAQIKFDDTKKIRDDGTQVFVVRHATCESGALKYAKSNRAFAIYGQLESGTGSYCQASS